MKLHVILVVIFSMVSYNSIAGSYDEYRINKKLELNEPFFKLFKAKNYLLEGNIEKAHYFLLKIPNNDTQISAIKDRYQALIYFLKGEYESSLKILEKPVFSKRENFKEICLLKIINYLAIGKFDPITNQKTACLTLTEKYTKNEHLWINLILSLKEDKSIRDKINNLLETNYMFSNIENIKIWLKNAIYTNKEKDTVKKIDFLPNFALESKKVRELIGLIYYRTGQTDKAEKYIGDLKTTNSYNIKGNIEIHKKDYQKAFQYFQKAYKRKEDSLNSILISIPLSYLTQNWKQGSDLLGSLPKDKSEEARKLALDTIFKIRMKDYAKAEKQLRILEDYYQGEIPFNVIVMYSYVSLIQNNKLPLMKYTHNACKKYDGISCWLKMQLQTWEDFSTILLNKDIKATPFDIDIEKLKAKQEVVALEEFPVVDQKDIEEIDSMDVIKEAARFSY